MFENWQSDCITIAERLRPMLCKHGATFYPVGVPNQVRVGWVQPNRKNPWVALLTARADGKIELKLRVSRSSGFIAPDGPLKPSKDAKGHTNSKGSDSECDTGSITLGPRFPSDLEFWIRNAFEHCAERYNGQLTEDQITSIHSQAPTPERDFALPDELPTPETYTEGAKQTVVVNRYERDRDARTKCLAAHGKKCCVCTFDFGAVFGPEAEGYIHVHHLTPLSEIGKEYQVDPVRDLRPVCPNCHAMIHMGGRTRDIEEVRELLRKNAQPK